jgi:putative ABC transport system substrate-binding protein
LTGLDPDQTISEKGAKMNDRNSTHRKALKGWMVCSLVAATALFLSGCAGAKKVYHIGLFSGHPYFSPAADGFKSKMAELGYVEGDNVVYDFQESGVDFDAYRAIVEKFVADKVDLIFVFPTEATLIAKEVTQGTNIPLVFGLASTTIESMKIIDSISQPGGNITGVRYPDTEFASRRLEILLECAPDTKRVFIPYLKDYPNVPAQMASAKQRASELGVTIVDYATTTPVDLQAELDRQAALGDAGIDAILTLSEPVSITPDFFGLLGKYAYEHKLPVAGAMVTVGDYTSLFGLIPDPVDSGRLAAVLADKVLKGTPAGTIPVASPEGYLTFSLPAAQAMGITVPQGLLALANEVLR